MPLRLSYAGRPVKRRRRVDGGLLLIFAGRRGAAGDQLRVTNDEWRRFGCATYCTAVASQSAPSLR